MAVNLISKARKLYSNEELGFELENTVYALDSTTIDLCLSLFPWAIFRSTKAAIKLHTLLDLRGAIPSAILITDGACHDVNALDDLLIKPGSFYIMDRGCCNFSRLFSIDQSKAFFVTRTKDNFQFTRYRSNSIDQSLGLRSDHIGKLKGYTSRKHFPNYLRSVRYFDSEQDRTFRFLTNHLDLAAIHVCQLYKLRWQVELFFKGIKQHLCIKRFLGACINAVKTQIWIAISVYVLIAIIRKELTISLSLHSILQILSIHLFEHVSLHQLLTTSACRSETLLDSNRLMFNGL